MGNFNQGNSALFSHDTLGKQCAANAVIGLYDLSRLSKHMPADLNLVLRRGDQLYKYIMERNRMLQHFHDPTGYRGFDQIPHKIPYTNYQTCSLKMCAPFYVNSF